ncbi:uncharacterized protein LOC117900737 [Drosophila subobscura]|uniref:uncharacterized protein LOC117900737 n=1 Tax=Drosophila subobscura TaxID=7241 RepID=UPI00155B3967|nr:uncharacterized protein LOC117900737 [Drosophila subobscura]
MIIPEVDMLAVSKNSRVQRGAIVGYVLPGLNMVDYGDIARIDQYYLDCQRYRDYYRDPHGKMPKPERFRQYQGRCGTKSDKSFGTLMLPPQWREERKPIVYPVPYGIQMDMDKHYRTLLMSTHSGSTHTAFKR